MGYNWKVRPREGFLDPSPRPSRPPPINFVHDQINIYLGLGLVMTLSELSAATRTG